MSNNKKYIKNRKEYYYEISRKEKVRGEKYTDNAYLDAYKTALETRNFEIELYWKRSAYYWSLIGPAFAVYFVVTAVDGKFPLFYKIIIGLFGLVTSYAWHIASRGSKFWQKNWEKHINFLEDVQVGALFKTVRVSCADFGAKINPVKDYPISVSKINQLLSFAVVLLWVSMMLYECSSYLIKAGAKDSLFIILHLIVIALIGFHFLIIHICRSNGGIFEIKKDCGAIFVKHDK
jgi:hypothetical protein